MLRYESNMLPAAPIAGPPELSVKLDRDQLNSDVWEAAVADAETALAFITAEAPFADCDVAEASDGGHRG